MMHEILRLRDRGLSIFPVSNETKVPAVKWDIFQTTLPTYEQVQEWFSSGNYSVGVACGPVSGLFLLDLDFAKHPESRQFYESHYFPRTWTEQTKSGGLHLYFRWTDELNTKQTNTTSKIGKGVDTKGAGGYGKICPSAGYKWIVPPHLAPLATVPKWLLELLPTKGRVIADAPQKPQDWMITELEAIQKGDGYNGRTPTFTRVIGRLKAKGLSEREVIALLSPWAQKYEYAERLAGLVVDQFQRYPVTQTGPEPAEAMGQSVESFLADHTPVSWICKPFIAEQSIGFVAGLPETRKTFMIFDLALEAVRGGQWMGRFPVQPSRVLILDQERAKSETQRRLRGMMADKAMDPKDYRHFLFVRAGTSTRIDIDRSYVALKKEISEIQPSLIILDSFATIHTKNESNRAEIQQVIERLKEIRNEFHCAILIIHHETKLSYLNQREGIESNYLDMAGNVAIPAAAEFCMNVRKNDDESSWVYHTKSTLGPKAAPFLVKVQDTTEGNIHVSAF